MLSKLQLLIIAALAALLLGAAGANRAALATGGSGVSGTFASFSAFSPNSFEFFSGVSTGGLQTGAGSLSTSIPVSFQFLTSNSSGFGTSAFDATLKVTSSTGGSAAFGGSPVLDSQPLGVTTFTFSKGSQVLLTITSSQASITGMQHESNATLADTSGAGNIITYSSPYLTFGSGGQNSYSVALTGLSSQLGIGGSGLLNGFHSGGVGSFSASPVPEASTLVSFAVLILAGALLMLRQRRRSTN